jgi:hypothetical protein
MPGLDNISNVQTIMQSGIVLPASELCNVMCRKLPYQVTLCAHICAQQRDRLLADITDV